MVTMTRRTTNNSNGFIDKITCNLLVNKPFLEQVEVNLRNIFDTVRSQMPYKITLAFGFSLYDKDNDSFKHFYINEHLSRSPQDRNILHQFPNTWTIRNEKDENKVMPTIQNNDFFSQVRDVFSGGNYNYVIIRATTMAAGIFPLVDSAMYNDTVQQNFSGRGLEEEEDEEYYSTSDDDNDDDDDDGGDDDDAMVIMMMMMMMEMIFIT